MKQSKVIMVLISGLLVLGVLVMPGQVAAKESVQLVLPTTSYGVWYNNNTIGLPKSQGGLGFYEEEGLDVKVTGAGGSTAAIKIVAAGKADASAATGYSALIAGVEQGMPLISPFADGLENKQFIVVPEDSPIMSIRDLKGKQVGVYSMGSDGVHYSKAMAMEAGLDPMKDITLVPIGLGAQAVNTIKKGTVAGAAFWDTAIALMEVQGMKFRYLSTPSINQIVSGGLVVNMNWLRDNRSTAVKFFRALAKAEVFRKVNPAASIKVHWKVFPMGKPGGGISEEQALKNMTHVLMARLRGNPPLYLWEGRVGFIPEMKWQPTMDFFFNNGLIKKKVPVSQVFTNEFIAEANQFNIQEIIDRAKNYK